MLIRFEGDQLSLNVKTRLGLHLADLVLQALGQWDLPVDPNKLAELRTAVRKGRTAQPLVLDIEE